MGSQTATLTVKLNKATISDQVIRVDVEDHDRAADKATFVMDDPGVTNSNRVQEGMDVRIELGWETEYALAFVGRVRSMRSLGNSGGKHRVEVTCMDESIRLMDPPPSTGRSHVGTLKKILSDIAERCKVPLGDVTIDPMPSWSKDKPLQQRDRTDWQMLQDLANEYRARAFIEVNASKGDDPKVRESGGTPKLYFVSEQVLLAAEPMGSLSYCRGMGTLLEYKIDRMGSGASPAASAAVASPDVATKATTLAAPPPVPDPQPAPSASSTARVTAVLGEAGAADYAAGMQNAADSPVQPVDQRARQLVAGLPSGVEEAKRKIQQDRTRILGYSLNGTAMGTVFLRAKGCVTIDGIPSVTSGRWYVRRVNHVIERAQIGSQTRLTYRSLLVATR